MKAQNITGYEAMPMLTGVKPEVLDKNSNIYILVSKEHTFGTDAVLLSHFAAPKHSDKVCDFGTGCGIIPMLLKIKYSPNFVLGIDIQANAIELFNRTIRENNLENIKALNADVKLLKMTELNNSFDLITCNPPYKVIGTGIKNSSLGKTMARHELSLSTDELLLSANKLLRYGGRLCLCNRPERLTDTIISMNKAGIEAKRIRFIHKNQSCEPWLFLIEGKKGGKSGVRILPPLFLYNTDGTPSDEYVANYAYNLSQI